VKTIGAFFLALAAASPLGAQTARPASRAGEPGLSFRPFLVATAERFAAATTFDATLGGSVWSFWGGGLQAVWRGGWFVEASVSRFKKTGERAFLFEGQPYRLGIPLTATVTPFEISGGFRHRRSRNTRLIPYVGAGVGSYGYTETSDFAEAGENIEARHMGFLAVGGVEIRVHPWVGLAVDAEYTHVPGILGTGGLSKDAGEHDLGGVAARLKVVVGR
jgi:hypothetical protein